MSIYAVRKHRGAWAICDEQKPVMLLESYEEAKGRSRCRGGAGQGQPTLSFQDALSCKKANVGAQA
jgi:hypothetical protein